MQVPPHINQMSTEDLKLYICNTPGHEATPMEMFLISQQVTNQDIKELEDKIESLEETVKDLERDNEFITNEMDDAIVHARNLEHDLTEAQEQIALINVTFPEDMVEFCKEARQWQTNCNNMRKELVERTHEAINAVREMHEMKKEILDLRLQIKLFDAAGLERNDA